MSVHHHGRNSDDAPRDPGATGPSATGPSAVDHHDHDPIVELEYYGRGITADIVLAKLKANDIPCFSQNEPGAFRVAWDPLGKTSSSVHVFKSDLEKARALLAEDES